MSGAAGTTGAYNFDAFLNPAAEDEGLLGSRNDSSATAQDLDASFLPLGSGAEWRGAVVGGVTTGTLQDGFESGDFSQLPWTTSGDAPGS